MDSSSKLRCSPWNSSLARPKRQRLRIAISWVSCEIFRSFQWISLFCCSTAVSSEAVSCLSSSTFIAAMSGFSMDRYYTS
jgi:hypothetical protein